MATIDYKLESYDSPHPSLTDTASSSPVDSLGSESPTIKKKKKKNKSKSHHHRHRSIAVDNGNKKDNQNSKDNQDSTDTTTKIDYSSSSARDVESFGSDFTNKKPPRHAGRRPSVGLDSGKNNQSSLYYHGSSNIEVPLGGNDELNQPARHRGTRNDRKKRVGKVYFIRHGESTANEANVYSGVTDVSLTKFGVKQAHAAGVDMKKKGIKLDAVYTSHLVRTRKTAAVALNVAGLVPNDDPSRTNEWPVELQPICMPSLAERSFGVFTGENKVLLRRALGHEEFEGMVHSPAEAPPCAETIGSIYKRCEEFHATEILPRLARGENTLVVAHQYVLEAYALLLEGLSPSEYYSFSLPNGKALSAEDMKSFRYKTTSKWQKTIDEVGDKTILHGTKIAAVLFTIGVIARSLPSLWGQPVTSMGFGPTFQVIITLCLAISSWFVYLEIDLSNAFANTPKLESIIVAVVYVVRICSFAIGGLFALRNSTIRPDMLESAQWWVLLFAVPPALTTPTISLTWGGKVYLTAIWSSILSVVCGLVLAALGLSPLIGLDINSLVPFIIVLVVALLLPAVAAQGYRAWKPIDSKRYSKKWKFLGVVAFGVMGLAAGFHLTPADLMGDMFSEEALLNGWSYNCIRQFQIAFLVYFVIRLTAFIAARLAVTLKRDDDDSGTPSTSELPSPAKEYLNVDVFILLSQHNIFLWIAMASGFREYTDTRGAGIYTSFWATAFFFILPALEENALVGILAKRLLRTALSRTKVKAKGVELNGVWKKTVQKFVPEGQVPDFYQD